MARINIDDKLFGDERFLRFCELVGNDRHLGLGLSITFFKLAQSFWCPSHQLIPWSVFIKQRHYRAFLDSGLAKRRKRGVYVSGSADNFQWLCQKYDASRKAAELRKKSVIGIHRTVIGSHPLTLAPALVNKKQFNFEKRQKTLEMIDGLRLKPPAAQKPIELRITDDGVPF